MLDYKEIVASMAILMNGEIWFKCVFNQTKYHCYVCTIKQLHKCSPRRLSIVLYMLESGLRIRITYTDHMMQMFYCYSPAAAAEPWLNSRKCWKASTVDTNCLHIFACMEHSWIRSTLNGVYHWSMQWKAIANFLPCHHNSPGKTKQNVWQNSMTTSYTPHLDWLWLDRDSM